MLINKGALHMSEINILGITISSWIIVPVIFLVWVTLLLFVKKAFFKVIKRVAQKTKTHLDDIFIQSADFPLTLFILASGGIAKPAIPTPPETPGTTSADPMQKPFMASSK